MTKTTLWILTILTLWLIISCKEQKSKTIITLVNNTLKVEIDDSKKATLKIKKTDSITDFIPEGYIISEKINGDLNKDGLEDCIIIIKGTDKNKICKDENSGLLDRNRKGIIILLNINGSYELAVKNYDCFSSENEDGGNYYAPELSVKIKKDKLYINYSHGRYGYWVYTFRLQKSDFVLISYDASYNRGPVINIKTSINFLTHKKVVKVNTNENADSGEEAFKENVTKISSTKPISLDEIKNFDEFQILYE